MIAIIINKTTGKLLVQSNEKKNPDSPESTESWAS